MYTRFEIFLMLMIGAALGGLVVYLIQEVRKAKVIDKVRTDLGKGMVLRSVEHENAMVAASEQVRISQEARREAEHRLTQARTEISQRVGQYDETIANLHRSLRSHQDKLREAQRRADVADERAGVEHGAREDLERRLKEASAKVEELEASIIRWTSANRGSDRETIITLEKELRDVQENARDLEVRLKTALAAVGDRSALERRLVESQERLKSVEAELSSTSNELSRLRVAHQAKIAVLEGRIRDHEKEVEGAGARGERALAEQAQAHQAALAGMQGQLHDARRQLAIAREQIEERDEDLDRLEGELEALRDAARAQVSDTAIVDDLERRRKAAEALAGERLASLERVEAELATAKASVRDAHAAREGLQRRLAEVEASAEEHAAVRSRLEEELDEVYDAIGDQPAAEVAKRLATAEASATERRHIIEALERELAAARSASGAPTAALQEARARIVALEGAVSARDLEIERGRATIGAAQAAAQKAEARAEGLAKSLTQAESLIAELEVAKAARPTAGEVEVLAARTRIAELEARLDAITEEAEEQMDRVATQAKELARLREAVARASGDGAGAAEVAALRDQLVAAERRASEAEVRLEEAGIMAQEQISAHEDEVSDHQVRLQSVGARLADAEATLTQQRLSISAYERELAELRRERAAFGGRLQDAELAVYNAEERAAAAQREGEHYRGQIESMRRRIAGESEATEQLLGVRDQAIADLERELSSLRGRLDTAAAGATEEAERSGAVEREQAEIADRLVEAMRRIEQATRWIAARDEAILDLQGQNEALVRRLGEIEAEQSDAQEDARMYQAEIAARDAAIHNLEVQGADLRAALEVSRAAPSTREDDEDRRELKRDIADRDALIHDLEDQRAELRRRLRALEAEGERSDDARDRLEAALVERDRRIVELERAQEALVARIDAEDGALAALHASEQRLAERDVVIGGLRAELAAAIAAGQDERAIAETQARVLAERDALSSARDQAERERDTALAAQAKAQAERDAALAASDAAARAQAEAAAEREAARTAVEAAARAQAEAAAEREAARTAVEAAARAQAEAAAEREAARTAVEAAARAQAERDAAVAARDQELATLREQVATATRRFEAVTLVGESELDPTSPDELRSIAGIGPVIEKKLLEAGFRTYRQIAVLDDAAIEALGGALAPLRSRFRRENWIEQAKKLHLAKYGEVV